jgi:multidrug resistance protein
MPDSQKADVAPGLKAGPTAIQSRWTIVVVVTLAAFTDILAYSIAVPVLPDLGRRLGASPTVLGLLFGSFGITLLGVSIPMGAVSDRIGRKRPLLAGMLAVVLASLVFAFADSLAVLFVARMVQGAADAVTWVVGLALLADAYAPAERGRMNGIVMSGASFGFMVGPTMGGWLYEIGGLSLPFLSVAALALVATTACAFIHVPAMARPRDTAPILSVVRIPAVASCAAAVIVAAATLAMLEPVLALHLQSMGVNPGRIGTLFGVAALVTIVLHPVYGHLSDRYGSRRLMLLGLALCACMLPVFGLAGTFSSAMVLYPLQIVAAAMAVTPSLAYMADATSEAGVESFGVSYGVYNVAWGIGLLVGPAVGGALFEDLGLSRLMVVWAPVMLALTLLLIRSRPLKTGSRAV